MDDFLFERITQTLAANQELKRTIRATEFRLSEAIWPVTVYFMQGGRIVGEAAGMLAGDSVKGMEFDAFVIKNGAQAQNITVTVSRGGAGSDRIMGSVEVIDGGKSRVMSNAAYWGKTSANAVVGQYSHCQFWNPIGSGKNTCIKRIGMYTMSGAAVECGFGFHTVQATNAFAAQPVAKLSGGAAAATQSRYENSVGLAYTNDAGAVILRPQTLEQYEFTEPLVITPGKGFVVFAGIVNAHLTVNAEFYEESAT